MVPNRNSTSDTCMMQYVLNSHSPIYTKGGGRIIQNNVSQNRFSHKWYIKMRRVVPNNVLEPRRKYIFTYKCTKNIKHDKQTTI
jgi:hypothetical protein